ncbi:MAG: hypothetical protein DRI77_03050 [Chloroflexi bacterium]|nr:MAG: hypothetical protein DRI77_03050 [Chloroflexota bacterium]
MDTRVKLIYLLRRNLFSVQLSTVLRRVSPQEYLVQKGRTRLCIEGYPRSGNTFAALMFHKANDAHLGHHTHCTGQIARALRYGIPVVVPIRNPVDAITSSVFALGNGDVDSEVYRYLAFYRWVEPRIDSVVLAPFEIIITDFNQVIKRVNEKYRTEFNYVEDLEDATKQIRRYFDDLFDNQDEEGGRLKWVPAVVRDFLPGFLFSMEEQRDSALRWKPIPVSEREKGKQELVPLVSGHRHIDQAQALYDRLVDRVRLNFCMNPD